MSCVYVTSDWHLGHTNAYKWSGDYSSPEERNKAILDNYRQTVSKRDVVWFLGDIAFSLEMLAYVDELPGRKYLILGNHDTDHFSKQIRLRDLSLVFDKVHGICSYKDAWFSHAPIHEQELRGKINIHGHVHHNTIKDNRYYNACLENNNFKPKKYQEILDELKRTSS